MDDRRKEIFGQIRELMRVYVPPFSSKVDDETHFDLWSFKDLVVFGRERKEIYLAGLTVQKSYVGFYYMPIYANPELKSIFSPEFGKLLKGKSCFHIKTLDEALLEQVGMALKIGFESYQKNGWV